MRTFIFLVLFSPLLYSQAIDSINTMTKSLVDSGRVKSIDDVIIYKELKSITKSKSPISIDIYNAQFFQKNPNPNIFESIAMVNGIKPQLNCSVCNTGDIHINGLEGAYTMVLIDGMPIVSSLSTVYGLSGIPNSLVDRIEVIKGPASSLYGSEAMGGVINIITKNVQSAPKLSFDMMTNTWFENNFDLSTKFRLSKDITSLLSVNYFSFNQKIDDNHDNFTDMALQNRVSIFNKWNFSRKNQKLASFALRYLYEDRFGGELQWNKAHRGSDEIYGESILTNRFEAFGLYQWPVQESIFTQFSYNYHHQDSFYGSNSFNALQKVLFFQNYWEKEISKHQLIFGATFKQTIYDDDTPATSSFNGVGNQVSKTPIIGFFIQDQINLNEKNTVLLGYRFDYDKTHHAIHSPRFAWKFIANPYNEFRFNFGTGFRVVNLFTEDHSALTGSREVIIKNNLKPERSLNANFNYVLKMPINERLLSLDFSSFYTYFTNKIVGDFDSQPDKIIYDNLNGYGISKGISVNIDYSFAFPLTINFGVTYLDVYQKQENSKFKIQQLHSPKWSGVYALGYKFNKNLNFDFSGQIYGPMRLPILPNDFRPEYSPWFSIANIQVTKSFSNGFELYSGVKNIFNFKPKNPIMRPNDPFDKNIDDVITNPNHYTFDTTYGYASMQGIRGFLGIRFKIK